MTSYSLPKAQSSFSVGGCRSLGRWLFLLTAACLPWNGLAKTASGDFKLSGLQSAHVLASFAVLPDGARLSVNFTSPTYYENERFLHFRLYRDVEWPAYLKDQTCMDKIERAQRSQKIAFDYKNKEWSSHQSVLIVNTPDGSSNRPHYWYFVVEDCSLEQIMQDSKIPDIHFHLEVKNHLPKPTAGERYPLTHLSADELRLTTLHTVTFILSGMVAFFLTMNAVLTVTGSGSSSGKKQHSVHAALLWVAAAAALDAFSSFCEIVHIKIYEGNGTGSYFMDAVAAHSEACADALIVLLLLSIGSGWTLPSDVVKVNPNASSLQRFLTDMGRPMGSVQKFNAAAVLGISVIGLHVFLAQWGRTYNDDFESYHDLEHLPGKVLMLMRLILGFLLLAATMQTRLKCSIQQLQQFYLKLAVFGFCWFQSLPVLTWLCNTFVPYYLRHPAIFISSALLQSSSLILLAWLVTAHTGVYHQFSHMTADSEPSLTDTLSSYQQQHMAASPGGGGEEARTWSWGKAKVRLD